MATAAASFTVHDGALQKIDDTLMENCRRSKQKLTDEYMSFNQWFCETIQNIKERVTTGLGQGVPQKNKRSKDNAGKARAGPKPMEEHDANITETVEEATCGEKRKRTGANKGKRQQPKDSSSSPASSSSSPTATKVLVPKDLRVVDLRQELRARGLSGAGLKAQLIARLEAALEEERMLGPSGCEMPEAIMEEDEESAEESSPAKPADIVQPATESPEVMVVDPPIKESGKASVMEIQSEQPEDRPTEIEIVDDSPPPQEKKRSSSRKGSSRTSKSISDSGRAASGGSKGKVSPASSSSSQRGSGGKDVQVVQSPQAEEEVTTEAPMPVVEEPQEEQSTTSNSISSTDSTVPTSTAQSASDAKPQPPLRTTRSSSAASSSKTTPATSGEKAKASPPSLATASSPQEQVESPMPVVVPEIKARSESKERLDAPAALKKPATVTVDQTSSPEPEKVPITSTKADDKKKKQQEPSSSSSAVAAAKPAPSSVARQVVEKVQASQAPSSMAKSVAPSSDPATVMHSRRFSLVRPQGPVRPTEEIPITKPTREEEAKPADAPTSSASTTTTNAAPAPSASVSRPLNLLSGLHSLTSFLKPSKPTASESSASSSNKVEVTALKKAEEARKAAEAKEEERKARKALMDKKLQEKKQDAKLQEKIGQEAVKKRAEMLKRKERDEKTGNATGHSRAPEEKKLRLDQTQAKSATEPAAEKKAERIFAAPKALAGQATNTGAVRQPLAAAASSKVGGATSSKTTESTTTTTGPVKAVAPFGLASNKGATATTTTTSSALKDISVNVAMNSNNHGAASSSGTPGGWRAMAGEVVKGKYPPSDLGKAKMAEVPHQNYEISDREESSDDDYDSQDDKPAKKVPDWAKGMALREALEKQYLDKNCRIDPDSIFPEVTTCNLEDIFVSMSGMVKKRYRTRQSTGNWKRDELTVTEKMRYRRDMGY